MVFVLLLGCIFNFLLPTCIICEFMIVNYIHYLSITDSASVTTDSKSTPTVVPPLDTFEDDDSETKFAEQTAHAVSSSSSAGT